MSTARAPSSTATGGCSPRSTSPAKARTTSRTVCAAGPRSTGDRFEAHDGVQPVLLVVGNDLGVPARDVHQARPARRGARAARRRPACRCPRAPRLARKLSSVRCVTACAVRHQTRATSAPVSVRTRSKLCTPVWSTMPPPEASGRSSQSSGDGSKRWFTTIARMRPEPVEALAQRQDDRVPPQRVRHQARNPGLPDAPHDRDGAGAGRRERLLDQEGLARRRHGVDDVAVEARRHHGDDPSHRRIGDEVAPVGVEAQPASRACAAPRSASRRLRATTRSSGTSAPDVVQVALAMLAGADEADRERGHFVGWQRARTRWLRPD